MFPIRGLVVKQDFQSPYVVYSKTGGDSQGTREEYELIAAFPSQPVPDSTAISNLFLDRGAGA